MYPQQIEMLVRCRIADIKRAAEPPAKSRGSLRIMLDARLARRRTPSR